MLGDRRPPTLLVVDDEADMLENIARILRRNSYACLTAASGQAALGLLERDLPDLVLTDLRMPGTDGLAVLRHVRRVAPRVPVVIITAYASDDAAQEARAAGAAGFLIKPFTARELLLTIQQAMTTPGGRDAPSPPVGERAG